MIDLRATYEQRYNDVLLPLATNLELYIRDIFAGIERIDRISVRPKSIDRFISKSLAKNEAGTNKYSDPLEQIQDQIGARIIVLFKQDVEKISNIAEESFRYVENKDVEPEAVYEFSYFGKHFISLIPHDVLDDTWPRAIIPGFFELQIKTVFQHAWSEASHDVGYKPMLGELSREDKRALAFASAQAWGADKAFADIFDQLSVRAAMQKA
ncbi:GTP pyrophosphokinase [Glycocaulis alkaliphilus]|uniref:GTP pyrophosphokinase n=1 Tax=Glycocaulis alkaliphilus TaxID=1434191 RepID=UPI001476FD51|nr:RelA/SpoT domain-containing protein [Glycocaulis alkaliphilus]GGB64558.1 hypothetical protein GCM10007417_00320 [Glycocaulis alkaliphilus]